MPEHLHKWNVDATEFDDLDIFCSGCEVRLTDEEIQRRLNGIENLKALADALTSGYGWTTSRHELVPEERRGKIAKNMWGSGEFAYAMEYGILAALGMLGELETEETAEDV